MLVSIRRHDSEPGGRSQPPLAEAIDDLVLVEQDVLGLTTEQQFRLELGDVAARHQPLAEAAGIGGGRASLAPPALGQGADVVRGQQTAVRQ